MHTKVYKVKWSMSEISFQILQEEKNKGVINKVMQNSYNWVIWV